MWSQRTKIAVVGRPNVGKSTLFNILTESRKAVVKDRPGVTRDIQVGTCVWENKEFDVLDTGGVLESKEIIPSLIKEKVQEALSFVDGIVFVLDGRAGLCPDDKSLLRMVQKAQKPYCVVVNKLDKESEMYEGLSDFHELGVDLIPTSFEKRQGVADILEWVKDKVGIQEQEEIQSQLTVAIVGKPNVGKSSLCNLLIGENRVLVSDIAGTTVDAIDIHVQRNGRTITFVDTAGLRRKSKVKDDVEKIAGYKSTDSIHRADLVLLLVDVLEGPTEQDAKIVEQILEQHKTVILVANKSDIAKEQVEAFRKTFREKVRSVFHFYSDIPIVFISAKTGSGVENLFKLMESLWEKINIKISTSQLNKFFTEVIRKAPAPVHGTKNVKFYYLTQTKQTPPSFIAFANYPESVSPSYRRFLAKQIKERWDLEGVPVRIFAMKSSTKSNKEVGARA